MSAGKILTLAMMTTLLGLTAGCGGSRRGDEWSLYGNAPWDRAIEPPPRAPDETAFQAGFATGRVASVSADGLTLDIEIDQGAVNAGDPVTVVLTTPEDPSPRNFADEVRERRVGTARVVEVQGGTCRAQIVPDRRNASVLPGDKVTIRSP